MEIEVILNEEEKTELERCETIIEMGLNTFFKVGEALNIIKAKRLYRQDYSNFDDYCHDRWDFGRHRAEQLIGASQVYNNLLNFLNISDLPTKSAQVEPLTNLPPEEQPKAWKDAQDEAGTPQPPAKTVKKIVNRIRETTGPKITRERAGYNQDTNNGSAPTYQLALSCTQEDFRKISRTFDDPTWLAQFLLAASYLTTGELAQAVGMEPTAEAGGNPWD